MYKFKLNFETRQSTGPYKLSVKMFGIIRLLYGVICLQIYMREDI